MGREARSRWRAFSHACAVMREMTVLYCHRHRAFFVVKIIHIIKKKVRAIFDPTHHHRECLMGRVVSVSCLLALTDCSESFGGVRKTFFWIVCRHCCWCQRKFPDGNPGKKNRAFVIRHYGWIVYHDLSTRDGCVFDGWWTFRVLRKFDPSYPGFRLWVRRSVLPGLSWQIGESLFRLLKFAVNRRRGNFGQIWLAKGSW